MAMTYNRFSRFFKHLRGPWHIQRHFPAGTLSNIEHAIGASEKTHTGEIRFVIEAALHPYHLWQDKTPRQRAIELFASLGVWDTAHNNGVLIYLLLADHDVEIVADRGIHAHVGMEGWELICRAMEAAFRRGEFEAGMLLGIKQIGEVLQTHFPADGANENELPDQPLVV
jgi:uncharacterized membrane protein